MKNDIITTTPVAPSYSETNVNSINNITGNHTSNKRLSKQQYGDDTRTVMGVSNNVKLTETSSLHNTTSEAAAPLPVNNNNNNNKTSTLSNIDTQSKSMLQPTTNGYGGKILDEEDILGGSSSSEAEDEGDESD